MSYVTDYDRFLFGRCGHYELYNKLGAHTGRQNGKAGCYFAVWAPHAKRVSVIGDFNSWDPDAQPMEKLPDGGIWETFVPGVGEHAMYKYYIDGADGEPHYKADPFGFAMELRPGTASKVADLSRYKWGDQQWLSEREKADRYAEPISIYEVHLGSWKKDYSLNKDGFYNYRRAAQELAEYVKEMGYTHVELMGIAEHPLDASWGYQVTGYYAPTARYGEPTDFMYFVDYMHRHGIGVILDWVPAHFPKDASGLANFDGAPLYEYADPRKGEHPDWGTKVFDYGNNEVRNFLIANALFWADKYHIDALRVDAVASMLYLDYGRRDGQWVPNEYGENKNLEAIEFLHHLSSIMKGRQPSVMLIAEESTAWPQVTAQPEDGGLGFTFKWNMGWMNDFIEYVKLDPLFKKNNHNKLTFGLTYAFSENYILPISHDEVVHLKCSMLEKMPGYPKDKFANLKTAYTFMFGHPGRKLLFMGQEFAQNHEWTEERSLDWYLLTDDDHRDVREHVKKLLHLYRKEPALHCDNRGYDAFEWVNCNDADRSITSFVRRDPDVPGSEVLVICNFTPMERADYCVGVKRRGKYRFLLSSVSDVESYRGNNAADKAGNAGSDVSDRTRSIAATKEECDGLPFRISFDLKPFESVMIKYPAVRKKTK